MSGRPPLGATARARVTLVDVVFLAAAFFVLAALSGPIFTVLNQQAGYLSRPTAYLFRMVVGGLLISLLIVVWRTAVGGGSR